MTNPEPEETSGTTRKIRRLAIGVVAFMLVYTAIWFVAAQQIEARLPAYLAARKTANVPTADCAGLDVRGYPFRIGIFCKTLQLEVPGAFASFGALRSAAQAYWPGHAILELDGPADIRLLPGISVAANWLRLRASVQAGFSGLNRWSLASEKIAGAVETPEATMNFAADHGEIHLRRNAADLDAALSIDRLDLKPAGGPALFPVLSTGIDLTMSDRAGVLLDGGKLSAAAFRNGKGTLRSLTLDLGGGLSAAASGPFTIDKKGRISGDFRVKMTDVEGLRKILVTVFPDEDGVTLIDNIATMLTALSKDGAAASVTIKVQDGTAYLAFFPIGELPQI